MLLLDYFTREVELDINAYLNLLQNSGKYDMLFLLQILKIFLI
jgi:hypothetical protein